MAIDIACKPVDSDREAEIPMVLSAGAVCRDAHRRTLHRDDMKYSRLGLVRIDAFNHFLSDAFEQMQYAALRGLARDQLAGLRTGSLERPQRGDAVLDQGLHAVAMKPEQSHRQLPEIVACWARRHFTRTTQGVGRLFFNMRSLMLHRRPPWWRTRCTILRLIRMEIAVRCNCPKVRLNVSDASFCRAAATARLEQSRQPIGRRPA